MERTPAASVFGGDPVDSGAEDEADDRPTTFGEKLRAGKDEEEEVNSEEDQSKVALTEQERECALCRKNCCGSLMIYR